MNESNNEPGLKLAALLLAAAKYYGRDLDDAQLAEYVNDLVEVDQRRILHALARHRRDTVPLWDGRFAGAVFPTIADVRANLEADLRDGWYPGCDEQPAIEHEPPAALIAHGEQNRIEAEAREERERCVVLHAAMSAWTKAAAAHGVRSDQAKAAHEAWIAQCEANIVGFVRDEAPERNGVRRDPPPLEHDTKARSQQVWVSVFGRVMAQLTGARELPDVLDPTRARMAGDACGLFEVGELARGEWERLKRGDRYGLTVTEWASAWAPKFRQAYCESLGLNLPLGEFVPEHKRNRDPRRERRART